MAYTTTFGGKPCLDPTEVFFSMGLAGEAVPESFYLANSYVNPLGREPGQGYVLMSRGVLDTLNKNALHTVVMDAGMGPQSILTIKDAVFIKATRLMHGVAGQSTAPYLVHFADRRWEMGANPYYRQACNKIFNLPVPQNVGELDPDSLIQDSPWTWSEMVQELWDSLTPLGTYTDLPYTPHGTPYNFSFVGTSAWDALNLVLTRIGCAIKHNNATATYSIVRLTATDAAFDQAVAKWSDKRKIEDDEIVEGTRGKVPYGCRVFFPRWDPPWTHRRAHSIDVIGPYYQFTITGNYHALWDDMPAKIDQKGTVINQSDLQARAEERTKQYFDQLATYGQRDQRVFSGIITDFAPGASCKAVAWRMKWGASDGNVMSDETWAWVTEIAEAPEAPPFDNPAFLPSREEWVQLKDEASGSATASGSDCGDYESGSIFRYNPRTCAWEQGPDVWIGTANAEELDDFVLYKGSPNGVVTHAGQTRPLYMVGCCEGDESTGSGKGGFTGSGPGDDDHGNCCFQVDTVRCIPDASDPSHGHLEVTHTYVTIANGKCSVSSSPCGTSGSGSTGKRYSCVDGVQCMEDPNGPYASIGECLAACGGSAPASYNCTNGNCVDPKDGTGTYSSLEACQKACGLVGCGTCQYEWINFLGGVWSIVGGTQLCTSGCVCGPAPSNPGSFFGQRVTVPCIDPTTGKTGKSSESINTGNTGGGGPIGGP